MMRKQLITCMAMATLLGGCVTFPAKGPKKERKFTHERRAMPFDPAHWRLGEYKSSPDGSLRLSGRIESLPIEVPVGGPAHSHIFTCEIASDTPHVATIKIESGLNHVVSRFAPSTPGTEPEIVSVYERDAADESHNVRTLKVVLDVGGNEATIRNCGLSLFGDDRFTSPQPPFREDIHYRKSRPKRLLVLGASTMLDNGGDSPPPYLLQLLLETRHPGRFDVMNLSILSSTIADHIFDWSRLQIQQDKDEWPRPLFQHSMIHLDVFSGSLAPREEFGAKDLDADAVLLAPAWNDFYTSFFTDGRKSMPAYQGVPLFTSYMRTLLRLQEDGNGGLADIASVDLQRDLLLHSESKVGSAELLPLSMAMERHYSLMLKMLIARIRDSKPDIPIFVATLPWFSNTGHDKDPLTAEERAQLAKTYSGIRQPQRFWREVETLQRNVARELTQNDLTIKWIDLSETFKKERRRLAPRSGSRSPYHTRDQMHFTPQGNEFLADQLYLALKREGWIQHDK